MSKAKISFTHRLAEKSDIAEIKLLMAASIKGLLSQYLQGEQLDGAYNFMGVDTLLIEDCSYLVVEDGDALVGCGGWSARTTLFGGDHSPNRDAGFLNPETDAARIRAMYTHPDWARRGIGRLVIDICEAAAAEAGFKRCELASTLAGAEFYQACGYEVVEPFEAEAPNGAKVPHFLMTKKLVIFP